MDGCWESSEVPCLAIHVPVSQPIIGPAILQTLIGSLCCNALPSRNLGSGTRRHTGGVGMRRGN